jgi:mRNA-degrading endonuclease HigB of HigAB toxin-antitoxin module
MHLIGRNKLAPLFGMSAELDRWVHSWSAEIMHGSWFTISDVLKDFPNAAESKGLIAFPILGKHGLIIVMMRFSSQIALVSSLEMH